MSKRSEARREQRRRDAQRLNEREKAARVAERDPLHAGQALARFTNASSSSIYLGLSRSARVLNAWGGRVAGPPTAPEPEEPAPTFSECVIGYRNWIVDATGQLRAIWMTKQAWVPGANEAKCRPHDTVTQVVGNVMIAMGKMMLASQVVEESHPAPHADCDCGLYAWNDLDASRVTGDINDAGVLHAFGAVAAWGDLRVHEDGFRASHACVVALAYDAETSDRVRLTLERVAMEYRVPLVHIEALQAEAERHGSPLPADVRPTWSGGRT